MYVHIYQVALMESKAFSGNHKVLYFLLFKQLLTLLAYSLMISESRISRISRNIDAGMEYQQQLPRWQIRCSTLKKKKVLKLAFLINALGNR